MDLWDLPMELVEPLRLRRVLREDGQGRYRLQTDGRPLEALLGIFDDAVIAALDVRALVLTKSLSAKTAPALAGHPHLARFEALRIIDQKPGDAGFVALLARDGALRSCALAPAA